MKKILVIAFLLCYFLFDPTVSNGQGSLKFRISGNTTRFFKESKGKEVNYPLVDTTIYYNGPFPDFTHRGGLGFEAEVFGSLSRNFYLGFEISSGILTGENDNPGLYNFQFTDSLQLQATSKISDTTYVFRTNDPIKYRTSLISFMANFRFYPIPEGQFRPFIKAGAGLSLVGTDLSLKNPTQWMTDTTLIYGPPILFSTDRSEVVPALTLSGGIGFELQLTEKLSLYSDWSYKMVKSDLLDGRPNFNFNTETGTLDRFNTWASAGKFTFGIVYTLNDNFSLFGGGGGGSSKKGGVGGKTSPYLPFYELKPH
jgi:hypothetical protein